MTRRPRIRSGSIGPRLAAAAALALLSPGATPSAAGAAGSFVETPARLMQGRLDGTLLTADGRIALAPRVVTLPLDAQRERPTQVFAAVRDAGGALYLGTGPDGRVLRVDREGRVRLHATIDEPIVSALALADDGTLLAGTSPGGRVRRIAAEGRVEPWCETGELYVWSLAVGADGRVYAGTGERGRLLEIDPSGDARVVFDADEPHLVSLLVDGDALLAGGAGRGLLYRVGREGGARVVHDGELPEVRAAVVEADGSILVAMQAPAAPRRRAPTITLRSAEEPAGPEGVERAIRGEIEGLAADAPRERGPRGRLLRIGPDGRARELWASTTEAPFALALDASGRALLGTGEPARLWRVEGERVARLATLSDAQVSAIVADGRSLLIATSNPASLYRLLSETVDSGSFVSAPIDAGAPARWGRIAWQATGPAGAIELATRTGNSGEPDGTWSEWGPRLTLADGSRIAGPEGRYLQWRTRIAGSGGAARLSNVHGRFVTVNRAPTLTVTPTHPGGAWTASGVSYAASAEDADGDRLAVRLEYRARGGEWTLAAEGAVASSRSRAAADDDDGPGPVILRWPTSELQQGRYELRVVAGDQPSNPPGGGLRALVELGPLTVDRTPPSIELSGASVDTLRVELVDQHSPIAALELYDGERLEATARPDDGVCDDRRESFSLTAPGEGAWRLRGIDAAGNRAELPIETE